MLRHVRIIVAGPLWKVLLVVAGWAVASAHRVDADPPGVEDEWFAAVARAESVLAGAGNGSALDSAGHAAVAEQIRRSVFVLGVLVGESVAADTVLAVPFAATNSLPPPRRGRLVRITGVVTAATSLLRLGASLGGIGPGPQRVLTYVGASAAGIGAIAHRAGGNPPSRQDSGVIERSRTVGLETALRDAVQETERAAGALWQELRVLALDSPATDRTVSVARGFTNALPVASTVLDSDLARSAGIARLCAQHPGFDPEARERFRALAAHQDAVCSGWRERRWLFERSKQNALNYLVLVDRP